MSKYNYSHYYSDEEDHYDQSKLRKWNAIKHLTLDDYFKCPQTGNIISNEWNDRFSSHLEQPIVHVFNKHLNHLQNEYSNVLYRASTSHTTDLLNLVKHHLVKDYSVTMFEHNPDLADPLLRSMNEIREKEREKELEEKQNRMSEKLKSSAKEFNWFTRAK
jgi:hypothetical protein